MLYLYHYLRISGELCLHMGFPGGSDSIEFAWNAGKPSLISGSGRSPGEGHGNPL